MVIIQTYLLSKSVKRIYSEICLDSSTLYHIPGTYDNNIVYDVRRGNVMKIFISHLRTIISVQRKPGQVITYGVKFVNILH